MDDKSLEPRQNSGLVKRSEGLAIRGLELIDEFQKIKIDVNLVPDEGMRREGPQKTLFIKLWSVAGGLPDTLYCKSDWMTMDDLLFCYGNYGRRRTEVEKQILAEIVMQQWALAKKMTPYDEDDWQALRKLITEKRLG